MAENNLSRTFVKAAEIDFVNQFGTQVGRLLELIGVQRKLPVASGSIVKTYLSANVTLDGTEVAPGAVIPLSEVETVAGDPVEVTWKKHRKAVPAEDIQKYGFDQAVDRTDKALIRELQKDLRGSMIAQLTNGTGSATGTGLQAALAQGWGQLQVAFEDDAVRAVGFVNFLDVADYLATAQITVQTAFGLQYVENFLGLDVVILTSLVDKGTAYLTAADNLIFAYVDTNGELSKAFDLTNDETGIIGVTKDVNKQRLTAETITISGIALFAERLDGVIKIEVSAPTDEPAA